MATCYLAACIIIYIFQELNAEKKREWEYEHVLRSINSAEMLILKCLILIGEIQTLLCVLSHLTPGSVVMLIKELLSHQIQFSAGFESRLHHSLPRAGGCFDPDKYEELAEAKIRNLIPLLAAICL